MRAESGNEPHAPKGANWKWTTVVTLAALAGSYLVVRSKTRQAERLHPATGRFIEVDGVKLHYLEQGSGPVLVLLHGNMVRAEDFRLCGLLDRLAQSYRVIAFDRPGFGYSERPPGTTWTPEEQAWLLRQALTQLGADNYLVLGHSLGTMVALAMGLQAPGHVRGLVLLSGYYYPSGRLDVPFAAMPAIPVLGGLMRVTTSPLLGRLLWPITAKALFSPAKVPESFQREDPWMLLRPSQVRAVAGEARLMVPMAAELEKHYSELKLPVALMAGAGDKIVRAEGQSVRLHKELPNSTLALLPGVGHMMQHLAQDQIVETIDGLAADVDTFALVASSKGRTLEARPAH